MHAVGVKHTQEYIKKQLRASHAMPRHASTLEKEGMTKRRVKEGSREVMLRKPLDFIGRLSIKSEKGERKQGGGVGLEKYCPG